MGSPNFFTVTRAEITKKNAARLFAKTSKFASPVINVHSLFAFIFASECHSPRAGWTVIRQHLGIRSMGGQRVKVRLFSLNTEEVSHTLDGVGGRTHQTLNRPNQNITHYRANMNDDYRVYRACVAPAGKQLTRG